MFTLCIWWVLSTNQRNAPDTCSRPYHNVYSPMQSEETLDLGSAQTQEKSMYTLSPYCDQHF